MKPGRYVLVPLPAPSAFLVSEAAERIGALVVAEEDEPPPDQLDASER
jgi:hypothetical protein